MCRIVFLSAFIVLMGVCAFGQDPGIQDSIIIGSVTVDSGATFAFVPIYAVTDDSVDFYNLPLRWNAPLGGIYPGQGTLYYYPVTTWDVLYDSVFTSMGYIRQVGWDCGELDSIRIVPLYTNSRRHHTWALRFVIDPGARPQVVTIDSCTDRSNGSIQFGYLSIPHPYIPAFVPGSITIDQAIGIDEPGPGPPVEFSLMQNYPNPFNARTTISYAISQAGPVSIDVYNLLGMKITTIFDGVQDAGEYRVTWNAADYPSGIYLCRLIAPRYSESKIMMLLK